MLRYDDAVLDAVLSWIYPSKCALCGLVGAPAVCESCSNDFERLPVDPVVATNEIISFEVSAFRYEGRGSEAIRRLKYDRATALAAPLGGILLQTFEAAGMESEVDAIAPVPIHWRRQFERGFNQAELLVEALPRGMVRKSLLRRKRYTRPQVGLSVTERRTNLRDAFAASVQVRGLRILLVDDVITSGSTARACAEALLAAGAAKVGVLTLAKG